MASDIGCLQNRSCALSDHNNNNIIRGAVWFLSRGWRPPAPPQPQHQDQRRTRRKHTQAAAVIIIIIIMMGNYGRSAADVSNERGRWWTCSRRPGDMIALHFFTARLLSKKKKWPSLRRKMSALKKVGRDGADVCAWTEACCCCYCHHEVWWRFWPECAKCQKVVQKWVTLLDDSSDLTGCFQHRSINDAWCVGEVF